MHPLTLRHFGRSVWAAAAFLAFAAAAQSNPPPAPWTTFASQDDQPRTSVPADVARLVFLRSPSPQDGRFPADILIDGRYHASVLPGGFAEVMVCPGLRQLELAGQGTSGLNRRPQLSVKALPAQTTYVLLQSPTAEQPLRADLAPPEAQALLKTLRRQTHAVSRMLPARDCPPLPAEPAVALAPAPVPAPTPAAAPPAAPPDASPKTFTLSAQMLFAFGGSQPKHLSERGRREITALAKHLKQHLLDSEMLLVQGHTDPMGSATLNQRLSSERAETVRGILLANAIPASQVSAQGLGSTQLVVKDCAISHPRREDRIRCDLPNRRVEITVVPVKK